MPLPGILVASTKRMAPPTGVQARPVATPGILRALGDLARELGRAEAAADVVLGANDDLARGLALGHLHHHPADDGRDLSLERADACLARVPIDDRLERLVGDSICSAVMPCSRELLRAADGACAMASFSVRV